MCDNSHVSGVRLMDDALRARVIALFEEVFEAGRASERRAKEAILTEIAAAVARAQQGSVEPETAVVSTPAPASSTAPVASVAYPNKRAEPGAVLRKTEHYLGLANAPISPLALVKMAQSRGDILNPSSVRMALQTLADKRKARTVGHGQYELAREQPKSGASEASPSDLTFDDGEWDGITKEAPVQ